MGIISRGMSFLADRMAENEGETVSYSRPAVFTPRSVTAVLSPPQVVVDGSGSPNAPARIESGRMDFTIRSVDFLAAHGIGVLPQKGDRIDRVIGGRTEHYTVIADNSSSAWEYGDPGHLTMRVHARFVEVV